MDQLEWLFRMAWIGIILSAVLTGVGVVAGVAGLLWWIL